MNRTITVDEELFARLNECAESQGQDVNSDVNSYATAVLNAALETNEENEELTEVERQAIRQGIQRGLEAEAAGRFRPLAEVIADKHKQFNLPR